MGFGDTADSLSSGRGGGAFILTALYFSLVTDITVYVSRWIYPLHYNCFRRACAIGSLESDARDSSIP